ncbi:MAG: LPS assembly lipoprotein LptE [Candidatus Krumholzibacteriia bacterium]
MRGNSALQCFDRACQWLVGMSALAAIVGLLVAGALGGCGYNTTGRNAANVGDIYIPFFEDETTGERAEDLGTQLTELVVREFMRDKGIRVYQGESERGQAQKELRGTVRRVSESVLSRSADELEEEYRVVVTCSIKYTDLQTGDVLWQDASVSGDGNYLLEEGDEGFNAAVDEALDEVVEAILDKTVRAW